MFLLLGVYIIISGFAHVNWTESETRRTSEGRDETVYIEYYSDTQYLHSKTQVFHPPGIRCTYINLFSLQKY